MKYLPHAAVLLLCAGAMFWRLDGTVLWRDEASTANWARAMVEQRSPVPRVYYGDRLMAQAADGHDFNDRFLPVMQGWLQFYVAALGFALLGVSNTLGLSVLERARESALMRALGLQARSLRLMLLVEALLLALVGVAVGVAAGLFFGWLGAAAVAVPLKVEHLTLEVDLAQTLGMVGVAVLAAALASVLPGRRAAKASPTEALADI